MLRITVTLAEEFDDDKQEFRKKETFDLELEHSLVSLSKWEQKYEKPFVSSQKTTEETLDYIRMMILTPDVPPDVLSKLSKENFEQVQDYISAKMTATYFNDRAPQQRSRELLTAELIYYWMFSFNIPIECENWHLNRLLTLIRIFNVKNQPAKKTNRKELLKHQAEINRQNRERFGTKG